MVFSGLEGLLIMSSISCCVFMPICFNVWYWNKVWYEISGILCIVFIQTFPWWEEGNPPRNSFVGINEPNAATSYGFKKHLEMYEKGPVSALPGSDPATEEEVPNVGAECVIIFQVQYALCNWIAWVGTNIPMMGMTSPS